MKLDTSLDFGNATYVLADREIASMIADAGADVSPTSPLGGIDLSVLARKPPEETAELQGALAVLCAPTRKICLRTWPEGGDWVTYYGADGQEGLVAYTRNPDSGENLIIWPVSPAMLRTQVKVPLGSAEVSLSQGGADGEGQILDLTFDVLLGLASLVDCHQEIRLRALADRNDAPEIRFDVAKLEKTYAKGLESSENAHWLVSRLSQAVGIAFPKTLPKAKTSLEQFVELRILIEDVGGLSLLPTSELLLRQLANLEGFSALEVTNFITGQTERRFFQANQAQIWRCQIGNDKDGPVSIQLDDISRQVLSDDLAELLPSGAPSARVSPPALACPSCGTSVSEEQSFCAACGTNLKATPELAPPSDVCSKCGATLEGGLKFCTQCGHPAASQ